MLESSLCVRPALPDDAWGCANVHYTSWVETYSGILPASHWVVDTFETRIENWKEWLDLGRPATVAELDSQIVGFAITSEARKRGEFEPARDFELSSLYVLAVHHGFGIGQKLMEIVAPQDRPAQLWVAEQNSRARRFYERNGFELDGARFVDENLGIAEVRYVRPRSA